MAEPCLFCEIVSGRVPARRVYEDERVLAFHDINPMAPVHVLVVPKVHISCAADDPGSEVWGAVMDGAVRVAELLGVSGGYRLVVNSGEQAGQTIPHLHVHVLAGRRFNWPPG
ncbi:histidine triad nucleotide-binding protein [Thermanaerovibrio acidaminovorans]|uniref:Histidine triad (HIT) protein n=1 Tax=Thermanaerovibrio acidaminovorans (strain ATCC 49978 / DSM 6589 / Su883) TaxID=525903 RepID=D1B9B2_THEAS|nr:histidine triad nucleotide-binding protein [Thermanaerovibrio acidaminovorans]ACZ18865.1 histidine triad (HIT) protein [Thermanaerovibrio acidaminovorans DSM 6589]